MMLGTNVTMLSPVATSAGSGQQPTDRMWGRASQGTSAPSSGRSGQTNIALQAETHPSTTSTVTLITNKQIVKFQRRMEEGNMVT